MNNKDIEPHLLVITHQFLQELEAERAMQAITLEASLERELGIDSLGKVELFRRIEKAFSVRLPEKAVIEADSLRDLAELIKTISKANKRELNVPALSKDSQQYSTQSEHLSVNIDDLKHVETLVELLKIYATSEPNRPHIYLQNDDSSEKIIRYGQLFSEAQNIAKDLIRRGIKQGDTVAIMLPTGEDFFYSFFGVLLAGAIPVPIYPPFRPDRIEEYAKREARILTNAQVKLLITFSEAKFLSQVLSGFIPCLQEVIMLSQIKKTTDAFIDVAIKSSDIVLIQYTSGSTGDPKGVTLTHKNMLSNIRAIGKAVSIQSTDISVSWLPLYHDMGLMAWLNSLYFGTPVTILSPMTFIMRPERWLWAIHYHRATLSGGPNFAYELCIKKINPEDIEGLDLSSWRFAFNGAEGIHPKTLQQFAKKFAPYGFKLESFAPVYGLAECTVGLTFPPKNREPYIDIIQRESFEKDNKAVVASQEDHHMMTFVGCGEALENHAVRIVDDAGVELEGRLVGNIQFQGPSAMQGYYNNPLATQKVFYSGWWSTGDLGYLVEKELFVTGRKKDLIIKAGRNISPEDVEEVVNQVAQIRQGCVIAFGVTDVHSGTEKLIVVAETYQLNKEKQGEIRTVITENMSTSLGIPPDEIILVPPKTIQKTSSGKLQRSVCKEEYVNGELLQEHGVGLFKTSKNLLIKIKMIKLACLSLLNRGKQKILFFAKLFYSVYVALVLLVSLPIVWLMIVKASKKIAGKIIRQYAKIFFKLVGCPIKVTNKKSLKTEKTPLIYVVNHTSYIDSFVLASVLPAGTAFVGKKELFSLPIIKTFLEKLSCIPVNRLDMSKSLESKDPIEALVLKGQSVVIFPEGTFTRAPGLRPFKLGAFTIAVETKTPICPIAIQGTRAILRDDEFFARPGLINIVMSESIYPKKVSNENNWQEMTRLHSLVRAEIAKNCGEPVIDILRTPIK